jgi:hypothetical protein
MPPKRKYPSLEEMVKKLTYEKLLDEVARNDGTRLWWLACQRLRREFPESDEAEEVCTQPTPRVND